MARYKTLGLDEAEKAVEAIKDAEVVIADEKLSSIRIGDLRIYASSNKLIISQKEPK